MLVFGQVPGEAEQQVVGPERDAEVDFGGGQPRGRAAAGAQQAAAFGHPNAVAGGGHASVARSAVDGVE